MTVYYGLKVAPNGDAIPWSVYWLQLSERVTYMRLLQCSEPHVNRD